jgi:dolichol-phosphate mannosyltransferase
MGFKIGTVDINHAKRFQGKSSYSLKKLLAFGVDSVVSQSNKPLMLFVSFGGFLSFSSIVYAIYLVLRYSIYRVSVQGWTSLMVSLFFIAGLLLANMGILGLYIGKIFSEVKNRPLYIVRDAIRVKDGGKFEDS